MTGFKVFCFAVILLAGGLNVGVAAFKANQPEQASSGHSSQTLLANVR